MRKSNHGDIHDDDDEYRYDDHDDASVASMDSGQTIPTDDSRRSSLNYSRRNSRDFAYEPETGYLPTLDFYPRSFPLEAVLEKSNEGSV